MSDCRYCANLRSIGELYGTAWEPPSWECDRGWAVVEGEHGCADFMRETGSDDDLSGDMFEEPLPDRPPGENA